MTKCTFAVANVSHRLLQCILRCCIMPMTLICAVIVLDKYCRRCHRLENPIDAMQCNTIDRSNIQFNDQSKAARVTAMRCTVHTPTKE